MTVVSLVPSAPAPNADLLADPAIPRIVLDGREWPVPRFGIQQNRIAYPLLATIVQPLRRRVLAQVQAMIAAGGKAPEQIAARSVAVEVEFTTEVIDAMAAIAFAALTRGHRITREQFDALPLQPMELYEAMGTCAVQSGMWISGPAQPPSAIPSGEATEVATSTGTH